jgi:hypothetical protein
MFLIEHPIMNTLIRVLSFLAAALTANAQGSVEAMLNYAGTTPSSGSPVYTSIYSSINGPVGWTFQPAADIDVTALGAFGYLVPSHGNLEIGLWDSSGTLLASQAVGAGSAAVGQSLYESIVPVQLAAGQTYFLGAYSSAGSLTAVVVTPGSPPNGYATMSPEIQLGLVAYSSGSGFAFPATTDGLPGYAIIAPNLEFQPVPEPTALMLLSGGLAGLLMVRRGVLNGKV